MPEWTVYRPFVIPRLQIGPERKIGLITDGEDTAGVDHSDDGDDPEDACRQPNFEPFATNAHVIPACHFADTGARPKENQPTRLLIPRYWSASVARPHWVDTVEKGKNEPIEFFARALVKIDSS
jgi:hypothetical protein